MRQIPSLLASPRVVRVATVSTLVFGGFWCTAMYVQSAPMCRPSPDNEWGCLGLALLLIVVVHPLTVVAGAVSMLGREILNCCVGAVVTGVGGSFIVDLVLNDMVWKVFPDPAWQLSGPLLTVAFVVPAVTWAACGPDTRRESPDR